MNPSQACDKDPKVLRWAIFFVAGWYLFLCTVHYFNQRLMWNDEECVFLSIRSFSPQELFHRSLLAIQVFPRLYLLGIQQFSKHFDFHLLALRFFPFVAMISAFGVWLKIADHEIKDRWSYFLFIASWAGSVTMIYYAAELKQYSMDVLIASVIIWFCLHQKDWEKKMPTVLGLGLFLIPWGLMLSYTTFFFLVFPLFNLVQAVREGRLKLSYLIVFMMSLSLAVYCSYQYDMRFREIDVLNEDWGKRFISFKSPLDFLTTTQEGINNLFSRWFIERPRYLKGFVRFFMLFGLGWLMVCCFRHLRPHWVRWNSLDQIASVEIGRAHV